MPALALTEQLARHLRFIARSCDSYDAGFEDEAIRISVSIRVLLHQTVQSTALLTQLGAYSVQLLSTVPIKDSKVIFFGGGLSLSHTVFTPNGISEAKYIPILGNPPGVKINLNAEDWWKQALYISGPVSTSRKDIVLGAANKEGAHVDQNLSPEYSALLEGRTIAHSSRNGKEESIRIPNNHYSDLRQMAYELLNSPELIALAKQ